MTFTEAAVEVLRLLGKPLHYKRITEIAIERNLLSHVGKTPEITMSSRLATMVKKDRGDAPIIKVKPGIFGLRDFPEDVLKDVDAEAAAEAEPGEVATDATEEVEGSEEQISPVAVSEPPVERPSKPARPERKLPGTEVFPEEDDDDEPILAKLDEESAERDEDGSKKRKRRRRRRRGEDGEGVEAADGDAGARDHQPQRDRDRDRGDRGRGRDRDREHREHRGRGAVEDRRRELPGDWHREPAEGDVVGKELSDAIAGALESLGGQRPRPIARVAEELVRRGRLAGDPTSLVPTIAASARGDDAKRESRRHRPRFRIQGDEIALLEWALPNEAARVEREVEQVAKKQRDFVRRAFVRRVSELPTAAFMELLATWLNVVGVTALRGIRRPGAAPGELHLAGVLKQGPLETPIAIIILRDGASAGREKVVEVRGALHHYGNASAAWLITLGQVLSGAREEAQSPGAAPCALFDGQELARSMEEASVGLRTYVVPVVGLDLDLLDALRGPGARPAQQPQQHQPRRDRDRDRPSEANTLPEVPPVGSSSEAPQAEDAAATAEGEVAANGRRRRRRRRRRNGAADDAPATEGAEDVAELESGDDETTDVVEGVIEGAIAAATIDDIGSRGESIDDDETVDEERVSDPGDVPEDFEPVGSHEDDERDAFDDVFDSDESDYDEDESPRSEEE